MKKHGMVYVPGTEYDSGLGFFRGIVSIFEDGVASGVVRASVSHPYRELALLDGYELVERLSGNKGINDDNGNDSNKGDKDV